MVKVVPCPCSVTNDTWPPWLSTTTRWTSANPCPVPLMGSSLGFLSAKKIALKIVISHQFFYVIVILDYHEYNVI
jgi:hypothetical protein